MRFDGIRVRYDSDKSYDELLAALLADIGPTRCRSARSRRSARTGRRMSNVSRSHVGPSGFMLFALLDHGGWITKAGIDRKAMRVLLGNPLIAVTMLRHDVTAGLFAPVEVLLLDEGETQQPTYIKPSSLTLVEPNPSSHAATELDAKLAALAAKVTGGVDPLELEQRDDAAGLALVVTKPGAISTIFG